MNIMLNVITDSYPYRDSAADDRSTDKLNVMKIIPIQKIYYFTNPINNIVITNDQIVSNFKVGNLQHPTA